MRKENVCVIQPLSEKAEPDSPFDPVTCPQFKSSDGKGKKYRTGKNCSLWCVCVNCECGTMPFFIAGANFLPVCILHLSSSVFGAR